MEWVERIDITRETLWVKSKVIDEILAIKSMGGDLREIRKKLRKYSELQGVPVMDNYKVTEDVYDVCRTAKRLHDFEGKHWGRAYAETKNCHLRNLPEATR